MTGCSSRQNPSLRDASRVNSGDNKMTPSSYLDIAKRPATDEEAGWISDLVSANPEWKSVTVQPLFVIGMCRCGCRSIVLDQPKEAQNPSLIGHQGLVAKMSMTICFDGKMDVVSVLLLHAGGSLSTLEVVWYNFPDPIPLSWIEINREILVDS